jgi:hypothetical protein
MATIIEELGQRLLSLPAVLHDLKPFARVLDHSQINLVRLFEAAYLIAEPLLLIATFEE